MQPDLKIKPRRGRTGLPRTLKEPASTEKREQAANHEPEAARKRGSSSQSHSPATREQVGLGGMRLAGELNLDR